MNFNPENVGTKGASKMTDQLFVKEKEGLRIGMDFFKDEAGQDKPYTLEKIESDIQKARELREKWGAVNPESDLAEATIALIPHEFGWLGDGGKEQGKYSIVTEESDDYLYNHVDGVKEVSFRSASTVIRWAEDVTREHPGNEYTSSEQDTDGFAKVAAKVSEISQRISEGKSPGEVHYFYSIASTEDLDVKLARPTPMPKVVISIPSEVARELRQLYYDTREGDVSATEALKSHAFREEYLAQIKIAMEAQMRAASEALFYEPNGPRRERLVQLHAQAEEVLKFVLDLMKDPNRETENEWLRSAYRRSFGAEV